MNFQEHFRSSTSGQDWSITTSLPWPAADIEEAVQLFLIPHDLYRLKRTKRREKKKKGKKKKGRPCLLVSVCASLGMMLPLFLLSSKGTNLNLNGSKDKGTQRPLESSLHCRCLNLGRKKIQKPLFTEMNGFWRTENQLEVSRQKVKENKK